MTLGDLNAASAGQAVAAFLRCCGSRRWSERMAAARPFADAESMTQMGDAIWSAVDRADWLDAFASHPRIGDHGAGRAGGTGKADKAGAAGEWAAHEQSGAVHAADDVKKRLAERNRDYEARFGYIFIVCATGKSASEMLTILEGRLSNDFDTELTIAAEQQRQITHLRLAKLLDD
ncbi:MAG TPA: 2-oxo-4-hydroxy-4-carboxy-5-ureidoimidazoline decarboxylase [Vicinamibacterales bacterium]|nr:2-oxo-4-hydroxy-4-carboxy-5-ureidoimidazoline decarboxylase [Vicinamibacterales bacterium]